jgi:phosphate-selective porin OprO/OprP
MSLRDRLSRSVAGLAALFVSAAATAAEDPQGPASDGSDRDVAVPVAAEGGSEAGEAWRLAGRYGDGQGIEAEDGEHGLRLRVRAQVRSTVVAAGDEGLSPSADFQVRRMRVSLEGHAFGPLVTWRVQLAFAALDVDPVAPVPLRDAFLTLAPSRDLSLRVGQMKLPFGRQRVVSSGSLQLVERSIVTGELNLDRDVGVMLFSDDLGGLGGRLGYHLGVFGGDGRNRVATGSGLLYAARVVYRPLGGERMKRDLDEVDFERGGARLELGLSGAFNQRTDRARSTTGEVFATGPWADYAHLGADLTLKAHGLSVTGELLARDAVEDRRTVERGGTTVTDVARSGYGAFVQAGYLFCSRVELAGRVGGLRPLGAADVGIASTREAGGGVSYYVHEHALKVQADAFYLWEPGGEGRVLARVQLQFTN